MGNVEPLGLLSPINARGSLIHPGNKAVFATAIRGANTRWQFLLRSTKSAKLFYALLRHTKMRDEEFFEFGRELDMEEPTDAPAKVAALVQPIRQGSKSYNVEISARVMRLQFRQQAAPELLGILAAFS